MELCQFCREKARHISKESKAIAEKEAKSRYFEKYSEELVIPKCLEAIKDHCYYLSVVARRLEQDE